MAHTSDLVLLDEEELDQRLSDSRRELFNLRFQLATGQLDNASRVRLVRREVARILTVLREREILEAEGAYVAPTEEEHEAARTRLAAEDEAAQAAAAAARRGDEAEGEAADIDVVDEDEGEELDVVDEDEGEDLDVVDEIDEADEDDEAAEDDEDEPAEEDA
jgi:large subunit ribosomal protein L29